jgi:hypothetical protein
MNYQRYKLLLLFQLFIKGGHAQLFLRSSTAIPQLEGRTSAIAIPQLLQLFKEIQLRNCNSATAIFPVIHNFKSATSGLHFRKSNIFITILS